MFRKSVQSLRTAECPWRALVWRRVASVCLALVVLSVGVAQAAGLVLMSQESATAGQAAAASGSAADVSAMRARAIQFLQVTQNSDGSWTNPQAVGISGLVTCALLRSGQPLESPLVSRGLAYLVSQQQPSGGIFASGSRHQNYETCIAILALAEANKDGRYADVIKKAEGFLRGLQWDEGEGIESSDGAYGGGGYDSKQRPDMSNTQFLIEALHKAGVAADDPAMQKALVFVSRAQNLESAHNTLPFAARVNDGGFIYTPAKGGESKAGETDNGGLRSYGSITYAGLKSLIFAGLDREDERVKAAMGWIRANYTLDENPGMGQQGLFYYYHTFSRTMSVLREPRFTDAKGVQHDWQAELTAKLSRLQQANGSWTNPADRWYEGDPNLVTAYCLLSLSYCEAP